MARLCALVDDIVLVDDAAPISTMRLALHTLGLVLEPAGAAGLAALAVHDLPGSLAATVLTGGNARHDLLETLTSQGEPGRDPTRPPRRRRPTPKPTRSSAT